MLYIPPQAAVSWTDDRVSLLKSEYVAGRSAAQIANKLGGTTRNAVIGKINRLGLNVNNLLTETEIATKFARDQEAKRLRSERAALKARLRANRLLNTNSPTLYQRFVKRPADDLSARAKHIPFIDLEPQHCRFPYGTDAQTGYTFCGHDKDEGSSYCADHRALTCVEVTLPTPTARKYFGTYFAVRT